MEYFTYNSDIKKFEPATLVPASDVFPKGMITPFAGSTAPTGWLICDGSTFSATAYPQLAAVLGNTYGTRSGDNCFLPDLRGRTIAGRDSVVGTTAANRITSAVSGVNATTLGATGGDERLHQHTHPNTVAGTFATSDHGHGPGSFHAAIGATDSDPSRIGYVAGYNSGGPGTATYSIAAGGLTINTSPFNHYTPVYGGSGGPSATSTTAVSITNASNAQTGASQNLPPTIVLNYIIKA